MSDRSKAIEIAVEALSNTNGAWRNWGALNTVRKAIKAMEAAGYEVRLIDGRNDAEQVGQEAGGDHR